VKSKVTIKNQRPPQEQGGLDWIRRLGRVPAALRDKRTVEQPILRFRLGKKPSSRCVQRLHPPKLLFLVSPARNWQQRRANNDQENPDHFC
jgi:hypothetical protein